MSGDWTVRVEGVWRKFGVSAHGALKYGIIDSARRLLGGTKDSEHLRDGEFWALRDVSFELGRGEALGIMGVNGSGKTTLLRILNGTYSPDRGKVSLRGRVGSLIAAGAGFSPMLSGRENIHINGLLLGLTPAEIRRRFDEIVNFAGLEEFIDMPVRNYSSGMSIRLGFSIAILGHPEILLVDEVLAVGDMAFQKRCYDRIANIRKNGTTIIFVSHGVGAVWAICDSGLFLNKGISSGKISVEDLGRRYELQNARNLATESANAFRVLNAETGDVASLSTEGGGVEGGGGDAYVSDFRTCDVETWADKSEFEFGEDIGLEMRVHIFTDVSKAIFRFTFDAVHYKAICDADSSYADGIGLRDLKPGRYTVRASIRNPRFRAGAYAINLAVCQKEVAIHLYYRARAGTIVVRPRTDRFDYDAGSLVVVQFDSRFDISDFSTGVLTVKPDNARQDDEVG